MLTTSVHFYVTPVIWLFDPFSVLSDAFTLTLQRKNSEVFLEFLYIDGSFLLAINISH